MIVLLIPLAMWTFLAVLGTTLFVLTYDREKFWENIRFLLILDTVVVFGLTMVLLTVGFVASSTS